MTDSWYQEVRLSWIKESVEIFGHINRDNVVRKFGLTPQAASAYFAKVQERWPDLMTYNKSTKRYERNGDRAMTTKELPRVIDDDRGEITVRLDDRELRGWSYRDGTERCIKLLCAREYVEGYGDGMEARS